MIVTVTGGSGDPAIKLHFDAAGLAERDAKALAYAISQTYTSATYDDPAHPVHGSNNGGYLIVDKQAVHAGKPVDARGFDAIVVANSAGPATVIGGGSTDQTVLASDGGLVFRAQTGNSTVDAGGGANKITFGTGDDEFLSTDGNNTVFAGSGSDTIAAGRGTNRIVLGSGSAQVISTGTDHIILGSGTETVTSGAGPGGVFITGASSVSGSGYNLTFIGGTSAATITGGAGSYSIHGGAGGGVFNGASGGDNSIVGGSGAVTIRGGGAGDTLMGGAANDLIQAGAGNETLGGGRGDNIFGFVNSISGGTNSNYVVTDFNHNDLISLTGYNPNEVNYIVEHQVVSGAGDTLTLDDGTKILLQGFHGQVTNSDFKTH